MRGVPAPLPKGGAGFNFKEGGAGMNMLLAVVGAAMVFGSSAGAGVLPSPEDAWDRGPQALLS